MTPTPSLRAHFHASAIEAQVCPLAPCAHCTALARVRAAMPPARRVDDDRSPPRDVFSRHGAA